MKCLTTISISFFSISPFAFSLTNNCHTHPKIACIKSRTIKVPFNKTPENNFHQPFFLFHRLQFSLTNNCHTLPKIARLAHYSGRKISLQKKQQNKQKTNTQCTKVVNNLEGIFMLNIYSAWNTYLIFWQENEAKTFQRGL